jgi:outer membrane protein assembly factor BamB
MQTELRFPTADSSEGVSAMTRCRRGGVAALVAVSALGLAACGGATENDVPTASGPAPSDMCTAPEVPVLASYDLDSGEHIWHVCGEPETWYSLEATTDDTVYVGASFAGAAPIVIALDTATGVERWRGDLDRMNHELPDDAARPTTDPPTVDGVALAGGQDDPLVATDAATGTELWRNDDHLVYDDVWAVGNGAVYMNHQPGSESTVVAYELATGQVRWERTLGEPSYPWWVDDDLVFSSWTNVTAMRTDDGSMMWTSDYPQTETGFPAPRAVVTNDTSVFVSFASGFGSGD